MAFTKEYLPYIFYNTVGVGLLMFIFRSQWTKKPKKVNEPNKVKEICDAKLRDNLTVL